MFDRIARVYDPMNLVISAFQEPRWRKRAVAPDRGQAGRPAARRRDRDRQGRGRPPSPRPARWQRPRRRHLAGDDPRRDHAASATGRGSSSSSATRWPCRPRTGRSTPPRSPSGCATCPTTARGSPRWRGRSVRAGASSASRSPGRRARLARILQFWFDRIVPVIGRVAGQGGAYGYLVRSVKGYPGPDRIAEIMREAGLEDVSWQGMTGGIVTLHVGTVPDRERWSRSCPAWGRIPGSCRRPAPLLAHPCPRPDQALRRVRRRRRHRLRRRTPANRSASSGRTAPARPRRCG